jgi:hypothetical protein
MLNKISNEIDNNTNFRVVKCIDEYVWFDSFFQLDHGWIDFTPEELMKFIF